jgi:hypothetical protein
MSEAVIVQSAPKERNPFKGQSSYEVEDADFFFGRSREAEELTAQLLASRLTVLNAASGAGKTSLLNACVIPRIEMHGWTPVRLNPGDHPSESIRRSVLQYLLPPPEADAHALDRARVALDLPPSATLGELLAKYDDQHPSLRVEIVRPVLAKAVPFTSTADLLPDFTSATPYLCRVLRKSLEFGKAGAHLVAPLTYARDPAGRSDVACRLMSGTAARLRIEDLQAFLNSTALTAAYRRLLSALYLPLPGLAPFFDNLFQIYGEAVRGFGLVLILDQFEEVFTRYTDLSKLRSSDELGLDDDVWRAPAVSEHGADYRVRDQFFRDFMRLYAATRKHAAHSIETPAPAIHTTLPMRFVFSLREEYVSRLMVFVRDVAPESERSIYRLTPLSPAQATDAVQLPLYQQGFAVAQPVMTEALDTLKLEGRYVEPGPLQIICLRIWRQRDAARSRGRLDARGRILIDRGDVYDADTITVQQILQQFFTDFLKQVPKALANQWPGERPPFSEDKLKIFVRLEVLDILSRLITSDGTRTFVEATQLLNVPLRRLDLRSVVLRQLERQHILRKEPRYRGEFYEITHEFLLRPILKELNTDSAQARLSRALRVLELAPMTRPPELPQEDVWQTLTEFQELLDLVPPYDEIMLRSSVIHGGANREGLSRLSSQYQSHDSSSPHPDYRTPATVGLLSRALLLRIAAQLQTPDHVHSSITALGIDRRRLLESCLINASVADDEPLRLLIRRLDHDDLRL